MTQKEIDDLWVKFLLYPIYVVLRTFFRFICRADVVYSRDAKRLKKTCLVIANHQSFLDPPFVGSHLPKLVSLMARDSLFTANKYFGLLLTFIHTFPVKRDKVDVRAIKETFRLLKSGESVVIFPEGTRSVDGAFGEVKPGFVAIAKKMKVPILPTYVDNAYKFWPKHKKFPYLFRKVGLYYGDYISVDYIQSHTAEEVVERLIKTWEALRDSKGAVKTIENG